jgi:hypothetical protein
VFLVVSFLLAFPPTSYTRSSSPHSCYMPRRSHPPRLYHANYTWRRAELLHQPRVTHKTTTTRNCRAISYERNRITGQRTFLCSPVFLVASSCRLNEMQPIEIASSNPRACIHRDIIVYLDLAYKEVRHGVGTSLLSEAQDRTSSSLETKFYGKWKRIP